MFNKNESKILNIHIENIFNSICMNIYYTKILRKNKYTRKLLNKTRQMVYKKQLG